MKAIGSFLTSLKNWATGHTPPPAEPQREERKEEDSKVQERDQDDSPLTIEEFAENLRDGRCNG